MGETHNYQAAAPVAPTSRLGIKSTGGEIVEVQGGHIVRSTGRKDRHSKVCTAKGPRDRRVRLSAHTAIQFYDVQDRLGYDRPSKAVDWLIKKAKAAIEELEELPPWHPGITPTNTTSSAQQEQLNEESAGDQHHHHLHQHARGMVGGGGLIQLQTLQQHMDENRSDSSSFLPPSMDSDSIADTIRSFFPVGGASVEPPPSNISFQNYPPDLLSRTSSHNQDLRLSLQSFHDPIMLHHHQTQPTHQQSEHHVLFSGNTQLSFDGSSTGWLEQQHHRHPADISRYQRMIAWNGGGGAETGSSESSRGIGGGGFMFKTPPVPPPQLQPLFGGQNQFFTQRGPLQSSNTPLIRAWIDPQVTVASTDHHQFSHGIPSAMLQSSVSGIGFAPGGYSGFHIPARIQGDGEEHDDISNKPSSVSSDSRH